MCIDSFVQWYIYSMIIVLLQILSEYIYRNVSILKFYIKRMCIQLGGRAGQGGGITCTGRVVIVNGARAFELVTRRLTYAQVVN